VKVWSSEELREWSVVRRMRVLVGNQEGSPGNESKDTRN